MNRIDHLFGRKNRQVLSIYMTAGYPQLDDTIEVMKALQDSGVDMIELGMPFSDPLADGVVIQQCSHQALLNGMSIHCLFDQLIAMREVIDIPVILMGYLNPVLQFGFAEFLDRCVENGIDGVILPDLPLAVYEQDYREMFDQHGMKHIMLITPHTPVERIHRIAAASGGFLYMVADASITGATRGISQPQLDYFRKIESMELEIPRLIGFGIHNRETFLQASQHASGTIIGSAFLKAIGDDRDLPVTEKARQFVDTILKDHPSQAT